MTVSRSLSESKLSTQDFFLRLAYMCRDDWWLRNTLAKMADGRLDLNAEHLRAPDGKVTDIKGRPIEILNPDHRK